MEKRNNGFDLQKCLCMLMVIYLHEIQYGMKDILFASIGFSEIVVVFMKSLCIVAVNCFILISGYFMCQSEPKKRYAKLIRLWMQVFFYSLFGYVLLAAIPGSNIHINLKTLIRQSLPLLTNQYWFFTIYFVMVIVSPLLNIVIDQLKEMKSYKQTVGILLVIFSIIPTINIFGDSFGAQNGYSLVWFSVLYIIAGYIRVEQVEISKRQSLMVFIFCVVISSVIRLCSIKISALTIVNSLLSQYNSILVLIQSVSLFMYFKDLEIDSRIVSGIKSISKLTFAVYLLHENVHIRGVLWGYIDLYKGYSSSILRFTSMFMSIPVVIFIVAIVLEFLRTNIFSKMEVEIQKNLEYCFAKMIKKRLNNYPVC